MQVVLAGGKAWRRPNDHEWVYIKVFRDYEVPQVQMYRCYYDGAEVAQECWGIDDLEATDWVCVEEVEG
jgi:hypothetical protein